MPPSRKRAGYYGSSSEDVGDTQLCFIYVKTLVLGILAGN